MVLVAVGLLLILIQIMLKKPNGWLVVANAISLALALYGCCFINAYLVASYNVATFAGNRRAPAQISICIILRSLGPQALPALEAGI